MWAMAWRIALLVGIAIGTQAAEDDCSPHDMCKTLALGQNANGDPNDDLSAEEAAANGVSSCAPEFCALGKETPGFVTANRPGLGLPLLDLPLEMPPLGLPPLGEPPLGPPLADEDVPFGGVLPDEVPGAALLGGAELPEVGVPPPDEGEVLPPDRGALPMSRLRRWKKKGSSCRWKT